MTPIAETTITVADLTELRARINGAVITGQDTGYDHARHVYSGTADRRPAVIVRAADTADVQAAVRLAAHSGAELAIKAGGHSAAGHGSTEGGILLDLTGLTDLHIDPQTRIARVGGGLTAGAVVQAAGEHGLTAPFGDTESVGVGGITTGGGMGLLARKYGMTIDALIGAEVVTADGESLEVDADHHPELFWAIRGGGSNVGVVTRFDFRLLPVDRIVGGMLVLPATADTLSGYVAAADAAPDELTTVITILPCPPMPFVPAEAHGTTVLLTQLVWCGDADRADQAFAPFRSLATPLADLIREQAYPELFQPEPEGPPVTAVSRTQFLDRVGPDVAGTMIAGVEASPAGMTILQLRVLGGQLARVDNDATAFGFRDRRIATYQAGMYSADADRAAVIAWADALVADLDQGLTGAFVSFVGEPGQATARDCYPADHWDRLVAVKNTYDPANLFRRNHNIPPSS